MHENGIFQMKVKYYMQILNFGAEIQVYCTFKYESIQYSFQSSIKNSIVNSIIFHAWRLQLKKMLFKALSKKIICQITISLSKRIANRKMILHIRTNPVLQKYFNKVATWNSDWAQLSEAV